MLEVRITQGSKIAVEDLSTNAKVLSGHTTGCKLVEQL